MFEAIEIGPFILWTHLVFFLLAVWLGTEFFLRLALSANLSIQQFKDRAWQFAIAFFLGGRIVAMIGDYRVYLRDPLRTVMMTDGNFSYLGGAIGIGFLLSLVTRTSRATFLQWLDVLLPATSFGLALDWLGRFAAGQSYGKPTDMPWGIIYDAINVRYTVPIHPVQLYYAVFYFILTLVLLIVRKHTLRAGAESLVGIIVASLATMFFELFRGDFGIPVFATTLDFLLLALLFMALGLFATLELRFSQRVIILYELGMAVLFGMYFIVRPWIGLPTYELRFTQLLSVLALLAMTVYVLVHRKKYPHL